MIINILDAGVMVMLHIVENRKISVLRHRIREQENAKCTCILTREGLEGKVFP